jgi:hypothetical protein
LRMETGDAIKTLRRRPERSEAKSRDLFSTIERSFAEKRSLHSALRAPVETTEKASTSS